MSEHTKEPWYASQEGGEWRVMAADENGGYTLADMCCDNKEANARRIVACVNACDGITNKQLGNIGAVSGNLLNRFAEQKAALGQVEKQRDELLEVFGLVMDELDEQHGDRDNAPGHGHDIPGVWDSDNGELAGKPCAWCAVWKTAKELRAAIESVKEQA